MPALVESALHALLAGADLDPDLVQRTLSRPEAVAILEENGAACWSPLQWDSEMYGFPAARIDFLAASDDWARQRLVYAVLDSARNRGIRHLLARVDASQLALSLSLNRNGFELIDGIQTFSLTLPHSFHSSPAVRTRLFDPADLDQILALARTAYTLDRFHADPAVGTAAADRINEEWLRNSCSGQAADAVIVAVDGTEVLGYVTCKLDSPRRIGTIVMVATAAHARRRGVGAACTHAAVDWFQRRAATVVHVGTQLRNIPAARLYERCGFRLSANSLTWRALL